MFVNLKIDKINEILVIHKLLQTNQLKSKQTYIEKLSFQCASYLQRIDPVLKGHRLYIVEPRWKRQRSELTQVPLLGQHLMTRHHRC